MFRIKKNHPADAAEERAPRHLKRRAAIVTTGIVAITGLTAWALYESRAPFGGDVEVSTISAKWLADASPVVRVDGVNVGTGTVNSAGKLTLPNLRVFPESVITVTGGRVMVTGGANAYISGIDASGLPSGTKVEITKGCGKVADGTTFGSPETDLKITLPASATSSPSAPMTGAVLATPTEAEKGSTIPDVVCEVTVS